MNIFLRGKILLTLPLISHPLSLYTVQTVDLILPRIGRIPQLHFCIEKKFLPKRLCCIVRYFTLASQGTHDPATIILQQLKLFVLLGIIFVPVAINSTFYLSVDVILCATRTTFTFFSNSMYSGSNFLLKCGPLFVARGLSTPCQHQIYATLDQLPLHLHKTSITPSNVQIPM